VTLETFAQVGETVSGVGVPATFVYLAIELRENARAVRA
jgi:hypothetical protein